MSREKQHRGPDSRAGSVLIKGKHQVTCAARTT